MTRKACVRCEQHADVHPNPACPAYVEPAPLWLRAVNRTLTAILRRLP